MNEVVVDRKQYRYHALSVAGFVAQVVRYVASGHFFYVRVLVPEHKNPRMVDEKLLRRVASVVGGETRYRFIRDQKSLMAHFTTELSAKTLTK